MKIFKGESVNNKKVAFLKLDSCGGDICVEVVDAEGGHVAWLLAITEDGVKPSQLCKTLLESYDIIDETRWDGGRIAVCRD